MQMLQGSGISARARAGWRGRPLAAVLFDLDGMAARAAGIPIACVPHGYIEGGDPRTLPCDALVEQFSDLPGMLLAAGERA